MRQSTLDALVRYRDHHIRTGGFLQAVLSNNLALAVGLADFDNLRDLRQIVQWICLEMPGNAWGSHEKVKAWVKPRYKPLKGYFKAHEVCEDPLEDPALKMG